MTVLLRAAIRRSPSPLLAPRAKVSDPPRDRYVPREWRTVHLRERLRRFLGTVVTRNWSDPALQAALDAVAWRWGGPPPASSLFDEWGPGDLHHLSPYRDNGQISPDHAADHEPSWHERSKEKDNEKEDQ